MFSLLLSMIVYTWMFILFANRDNVVRLAFTLNWGWRILWNWREAGFLGGSSLHFKPPNIYLYHTFLSLRCMLWRWPESRRVDVIAWNNNWSTKLPIGLCYWLKQQKIKLIFHNIVIWLKVVYHSALLKLLFLDLSLHYALACLMLLSLLSSWLSSLSSLLSLLSCVISMTSWWQLSSSLLSSSSSSSSSLSAYEWHTFTCCRCAKLVWCTTAPDIGLIY